MRRLATLVSSRHADMPIAASIGRRSDARMCRRCIADVTASLPGKFQQPTTTLSAQMSRRLGLWILAAPLLFVLHEAEEYRTMLPWLAEHESIIPKAIRAFIPRDPAFIAYAGVFFLMVFLIVGVWAVRSRPLSAASVSYTH